MSTGPKRLFATIKTEESGRYNLVECIKLSPDGKFKIFVPLKNGLNWLNFEFCRVVRHLVVNCSSKYAQVEQSHKIKLVYFVSSDSNGDFQVRTEHKKIQNSKENYIMTDVVQHWTGGRL